MISLSDLLQGARWLIASVWFLSLGMSAEPPVASGFRELTWGMPQAALEPLTLWHPEAKPRGRYTRTGENLFVLGEQADSIRYDFRDRCLRRIEVSFTAPGGNRPLFDRLTLALQQQFGAPAQPPDSSPMPNATWGMPATSIVLNTTAQNIELVFWDRLDFTLLYAKSKELVVRCQDELNRLLATYAPAEAESRMRAWLKREGGDLVAEDTTVEPGLKQITLEINGVGGWILTPQAQQMQQQLITDQMVSLSEALHGVKTTPEAYRGRDVLITAVVVDAVRGTGRNDYWVLVDRSAAVAYRSLKPMTWLGADGKPMGTPEQVAQFNAIATIKSGPTLGLPKKLRKDMATAAALRGHFLDPVYPDRFIVTGVVGSTPESLAKP